MVAGAEAGADGIAEPPGAYGLVAGTPGFLAEPPGLLVHRRAGLGGPVPRRRRRHRSRRRWHQLSAEVAPLSAEVAPLSAAAVAAGSRAALLARVMRPAPPLAGILTGLPRLLTGLFLGLLDLLAGLVTGLLRLLAGLVAGLLGLSRDVGGHLQAHSGWDSCAAQVSSSRRLRTVCLTSSLTSRTMSLTDADSSSRARRAHRCGCAVRPGRLR